jgi:hypothetical protein
MRRVELNDLISKEMFEDLQYAWRHTQSLGDVYRTAYIQEVSRRPAQR